MSLNEIEIWVQKSNARCVYQQFAVMNVMFNNFRLGEKAARMQNYFDPSEISNKIYH